MIETFIIYIFQSLLFLVVTYLTGSVAVACIKNNLVGSYTKLFFQFFIGIVIFVTTLAIFITQFKTILLGTWIVFFALILSKTITLQKPSILNIKSNIDFGRFIKSITFYVAVYLGTFIFIFDFKNDFAFSPHGDTTFYASVSNYIFESGIETRRIDVFQLLETAPSPYHYFDLWMNASFNLFRINKPVLNFLLNTYTIAYWLLFIGFLGIIENFKSLKVSYYIVAFVLPMASVFYVPTLFFNITFFRYLGTFEVNPIGYAKIFIVYWCFLAFCLLYQHGKKNLAICFLGIIPVFYTTSAPVILCFFLLVSLYQIFYVKQFKVGFLLGIYTLSLLLFIGGFYLLTTVHTKTKEISAIYTIDAVFIKSYLKTAFNIIIGSSLHILILYCLPIGLLIKVFYREVIKYKFEVLSLFSLVFGGLVIWAIFNFMGMDAVQLFTNISQPILNVSIGVFTAYFVVMLPKNKFYYFGLTCFTVIYGNSIYRNLKHSYQWHERSVYSPAFLNNIKNLVQDNGNHWTGILSDFKHIPSGESFGKLSYVGIKSYPIDLMARQFDKKTEQIILKQPENYAFYIFRYQKNQTELSKVYQLRQEFIKKNQIKYLISSADTKIIDYIDSNMISKTIIDVNTNEKFTLLKY